MADGMLALSWNNHASTFCHMLSQIRLKDKYTDATVACEGKFYPVHRIVLSTCSKYFEEMFELTSAGKHPIVLLQDVKKYELEAILSYMYAGVVSVAQKDLSRLIKIAELLQIKGLAVPDELPSEKKTVINQGNPSSSERTSSVHHKASHSIDSSDDRTSPYRKRRRREDPGISPLTLPPSASSSKSTYNREDDEIQEIQASDFPSKELREQDNRLGGEHMEDTNRNVRRAPTTDDEASDRLHQQKTSQDSSGKPIKDSNDELVWIKEEVMDDPGDIGGGGGGGTSAVNVKSEISYESIKDAEEDSMGMAPDDQDDYSQASHGQFEPPLSEPVAEALAGPSGIHEWLSGGDLAAGLSSVDNYGGEGSPPTSDHPQAQQMGDDDAVKTNTGFGRVHSSGPQQIHGRGRVDFGNKETAVEDLIRSYEINNMKIFKCPYCPYTNIRKVYLVRHMRTHTGEKPYSCPYCPAKFSQKGSLNYHIRSHTGEKPFLCPLCSQSFTRKYTMRKHMHLTHKCPN